MVGYVGHDPSKHRGPAYSIRFRLGLGDTTVGPGPRYNINKLTKFGLDKSPAYTIAVKYPDTSKNMSFIILRIYMFFNHKII